MEVGATPSAARQPAMVTPAFVRAHSLAAWQAAGPPCWGGVGMHGGGGGELLCGLMCVCVYVCVAGIVYAALTLALASRPRRSRALAARFRRKPAPPG